MADPTQLSSNEPIQVTPETAPPDMGETNLAAPEISVTPEKPEFIQGATSLNSPKPIQQTISGLPHEVLFDPDHAEPMSEDDYLQHLDDQKMPAWTLQDKDPELAYKLWQKQNPDQTVGGVLEGATKLGLKTAGNVLGGLYRFEAGAYTHPIDTAKSVWDGTKSLLHAVVAQPTNFIYQQLAAQGENAKPEDYITLGYSVEDATRMARDAQDAAKTAVPQAAAGQVALANFARDQVDAATRLSSHLAGALGYRMVKGMEHDISKEDAVAYMKHQRESDEMKQALDKGDVNAAMKVFAPAWLHAQDSEVQQIKDAIDQNKDRYPGTDDLKQLGLTPGDIKEAAESGPSTLSLLEFSAVPGGAGRAVGRAAVGGIELGAKATAGGLRTGAALTDFAQQKMLWAARHGYWTLGYGLINPHVILPAIGTILGAETIGRYVLPRVSQGLRAVARGAEALPATEAGKLGAKVSAYAASGATQFAPFAVTSNDLDEASQHLAMGAAFGIGHMAGSAAMGTRFALMRSLVNIGGERPFPWSDQYFDYGVDNFKDAQHFSEVGNWSNANQKMMNTMRHAMQGGTRSYAFSPAEFDAHFRQPGTPFVHGLYMEPGESVTLANGKTYTPDSPEIYYRGEEGFKNAKVHEPGHVIWDTLEDADKARFFKSVSRNNNPSAWATSYMSRLTGKHTPIDYEKLPDKGPGVTKALIQEEMFADTMKNFTIDQITSDPGLTRKLQFGIAKFMESMGVPMTPPEIRGSLGLQPTAHAMFVAENAMRQYASRSSGPVRYGTPRAEAAPAEPEGIVSETARVEPESELPSDIKPGPIKGTPPEKVQKGEFAKEGYTATTTDIGDPQTHLKPAVDAVRSLGFSANDAKLRVQNAIEEAKNMGLDVNLEDVVKRAINPDHSWPKEVVDRAQEALKPPTIEQEAEQHAKGLAQDSPALTGRTGPHGTFEITGNQIDVNDPFHQKLLKEAGLDPGHVDIINAMGAFRDLPVQFEYRGSGEGKSEGKLKNKKFIPQKIVYNPKAKSFVIRGFSPDKFMQMDQTLKQVLADHGVTPDRIDEAMSDPGHPVWDQAGVKNALASLGKGQAMTESIRPERIASPVKAASLENMSPFHREEKPSKARTDSKGQMAFKFMPSGEPEAIKSAAVKTEDGRIFEGAFHAQAEDKMNSVNPNERQYKFGWTTNSGEFLTPEEALQRAYDTKQTTPEEYRKAKNEAWNYEFLDAPEYLESKAFDQARVGKAMPSNPDITKVIDDYKKQARIPFPAHDQAREISEARSKEIADLYQSLPHDPGDPAVAKSYDALRDAVVDQYETLLKHGYAFEPWEKDGQPYANSKEMLADLSDNKHLYYFPTKEGYGEAGDLSSHHPMLEKPGIKINGEQVPLNDIFRAVHDALGHGEHGWQFGPKGEYNAFLSHASTLPYDALPALAMETLGQNSWVNFGPHMRDAEGNIAKKGEPNYIPPTERPFSEQKANVLPREMFPVTEGRVGSAGMWDRMTKDPNFLPGQMEDLAQQTGANPDKSFYDQKPDVQRKITDHMMEQGAKFMPRPGPETGASRMQDAGDGPLYHVTFTKAVPSIKKKGLQVFRPSNWGRAVGGAYQTPEVFAFDNLNDAARWAARMDWEFNQSTGSGKISIVKINRGDRPWAPDINDPVSQAGAQGNWVKREGAVKAKDIVSSTPFTSDRVKHLRDRTDQPKFMPSEAPQTDEFKRWSGGAPVVLDSGVRKPTPEERGLFLENDGNGYKIVDHSGKVLESGIPKLQLAEDTLMFKQQKIDQETAIKGESDAARFKTGQPVVVGAYHGSPSPEFHVFDPSMSGKYTGAPSAKQGFFFSGSPDTASAYQSTSIFGFKGYEDMTVQQRNDLWHSMANIAAEQAGEEYAPISEIHDLISNSPDLVKEEAEKILNKDQFFGEWKKFDMSPHTPTMHEVYVKFKNPMVHDFKGDSYREQTYNDLLKSAKANGHDGAIFTNTYDGGGNPDNIFVTFDNKNIKSTSNVGTFDPSNPNIKFMPSGHPDAIMDAAIRRDLDGKVFTGPNHAQAYVRSAGQLKGRSQTDGFITRTGRFLDRKQALAWAKEIEQMTQKDYEDAYKREAGPIQYLWHKEDLRQKLEANAFQGAQKFMPSSLEKTDKDTGFWHGSPSGDLRGGKFGLHVGTYEAAKQALNARIGIPASGEWDGTREYGKTLLAGEGTQKKLSEQILTGTGMNAKVPKDDYYPDGSAVFGDGNPIPLQSKPNIFPVKITGPMINTPETPLPDYKANYLMLRQKSAGKAKRGMYYTNEGEDAGSISAALPGQGHIKFMPSDHPDAVDRAAIRRKEDGAIFPASPGQPHYTIPGNHPEAENYLGPDGHKLYDEIFLDKFGNPLDREQAMTRMKEIGQLPQGYQGEYGTEANVTDLRRAGKAMPGEGFIGHITDDGYVEGEKTDLASADHERMGYNRMQWRYNPDTKTAYWWSIPEAPEKEALSNWLESHGQMLERNKILSGLDREEIVTAFYAAHGNKSQDQPSVLPPKAMPESGFKDVVTKYLEEAERSDDLIPLRKYLEGLRGLTREENNQVQKVINAIYRPHGDLKEEISRIIKRPMPKAMPQTGQPFEQVLFRGHKDEDPTRSLTVLPTFTDSAKVAGQYATENHYNNWGRINDPSGGERVGFYKVSMKNPLVLGNPVEDVVEIGDLRKKLVDTGRVTPKWFDNWVKAMDDEGMFRYDGDWKRLNSIPEGERDLAYADTFRVANSEMFVNQMKRAGFDGFIYRGTHTSEVPVEGKGTGSFDPDTFSSMEYTPFDKAQVQPSTLPAKYMPSYHPDAITGAAFRDNDTGDIISGAEIHPMLLDKLQDKYGELGPEDSLDDIGTKGVEPGFITKSGKFLNREDALRHAENIGQIADYDQAHQDTHTPYADEPPPAQSDLEGMAFENARKFMPQTHDTTFDMSGPKEVRQTLKKGNRWAIFSADTNKFTEAQNQARRSLLKDELDQLGYPYQEAEGNYQGVREGSVIIGNIDSDAAAKLAKKYGQESLVVPEGLRYTDGKLYPHNGKIEVSNKPFKSDFTKVGDSYFQYGVDFDNPISKADYKMIRDLPPDERDIVFKVNNGINRLLDMHRTARRRMPEAVSGAKLAESQRDWYNESADLINDIFDNPADADRFAAVTAAMSPRTEPVPNVDQAINLWTAWEEAGRPTDHAQIEDMILEAMAKTDLRKKLEGRPLARGAGLKAYRNNVIRALTAEDPGPQALNLSGPKVNSFFPNLTNHAEMLREVTNDRHMAGFWMGDPQAQYGSAVTTKDQLAGVSLKTPEYIAISAVTRRLAQKLSKIDGRPWTPRQAQAALWSYQKAKEGGIGWGRTRPTIQDVETFAPRLKEWRDNRESRQTTQPTAPEIAEQPF